MRNVNRYLLYSLVLVLSACSTTKHIPDDDRLFVGLKTIEYKDYEKDDYFAEAQEEIEAALATAPNGALFGSSYHRTPFPYGLWIWNWADGSHGKFKKLMKKSFGKAPVLMSQVNPALRASVAKTVLKNKGYMYGTVSYEEVVQKNPKKAKIAYTVSPGPLMRVDTMSYENFPPAMKALIDSTISDAKIQKDAPFSLTNLDDERKRISQLFRNNGYYYYQPNYASYLADTLNNDRSGDGSQPSRNRAKVRLQMADSLPQEALQKWYVGRLQMELRHSMREKLDSVVGRNFLKIHFNGKRPPIRPGVVLNDLKLRPRQAFNYDNYIESVQKLNSSDVFSSVDFQFTPRQEPSDTLHQTSSIIHQTSYIIHHPSDTLDLTMVCIFDKPYDFYVETNVINRTIGRFGPGMKIGFTKRNAFKGAEKLDINLHGSYEWESSSKSGHSNYYQYGADAALELPRILLPWKLIFGKSTRARLSRASGISGKSRQTRRPRKRYYATPWTIAKVSTDIIHRPGYYKMHIVSGEWTYRWQPSETSRHELSPLTLKYQFMNKHTADFDTLMMNNPYLMGSMSDYFIPKMRYTYTYASPKGTPNPIRWETSIEEAGNITALYDVLIQGNSWNQKEKTLFENPYSQYLRLETDLTKTWTLNTKSQLVGHLNGGIMWCYGNSQEAPFSELFYVGGANSIRAFPVRSIGPGAFPGLGGNRQFSYLLQNGDVKLVMNLEYRRKLFGNLYGALFLDAGNVWSSSDWTITNEDPDDIDKQTDVDYWNHLFSKIKFNGKRFFKELATGTGVGLRYDLDFLILRVDWGFGLHMPYDTGKSGYFNIPRFKDMHTLHLAIGYPF